MIFPLMMRVAFAVAGMDAVGADRHLGGEFLGSHPHGRCILR
jgi:hypothetical protein